uniref:Vacuolar protein sorting-associated protein 26 n=1 Tax=Peronospora matthiolae TaxID=2874970 RepID=A0AAV1T8B5_9STRA
MFNFIVPSADLIVTFERAHDRTKKLILTPFDDAKSGHATEVPLFRADENVRGKLIVKVNSGKRLEHSGLTLEMLGFIKAPGDQKAGHEFTKCSRELQSSGTVIEGDEHFAFDFAHVDMPHDSYYGRKVELRYVLRATLSRGKYASDIVLEQDVWIQHIAPSPPLNGSIKMEVGIEDSLHIEFEYDKSHYHLEDVVIGKISFQLMQIKIKHMELAILCLESVGSGPQQHSELETITTFEVMDGAPSQGESIPVRMYLAPYTLTPTYHNVQNQFSVKYFLNLVLVDEEDRQYFKHQEITLWRTTVG